jgi:hypothetical protein
MKTLVLIALIGMANRVGATPPSQNARAFTSPRAALNEDMTWLRDNLGDPRIRWGITGEDSRWILVEGASRFGAVTFLADPPGKPSGGLQYLWKGPNSEGPGPSACLRVFLRFSDVARVSRHQVEPNAIRAAYFSDGDEKARIMEDPITSSATSIIELVPVGLVSRPFVSADAACLIDRVPGLKYLHREPKTTRVGLVITDTDLAAKVYRALERQVVEAPNNHRDTR